MKTFAPPRESGEFILPKLRQRLRRPAETVPRALEAVQGELSLYAVLCAIPEEFAETLGARAISVYELAHDKRTLELVAQAGFEPLVGPPPRLDVGDSVPAARAVRQRTMQVMGEPGAASAEQDPLAPPPADEAMLFSIPLVGAQRVFGVVNVEFSAPPGPDDAREIAVLGELFGAALELVLLRRARAELNARQGRSAETPAARRNPLDEAAGERNLTRGK